MNETAVRTRDHNPRHVAEAVAAAAVVDLRADLLDGGVRPQRSEFEGLREASSTERVLARLARPDLALAVRAVKVRTPADVDFSRARH